MMSLWKQRSRRVERILDGVPIPVIAGGKLFRDRMESERVDEEDVLAAARGSRGIQQLDEIEHAIVETSGGISIIPKKRE